jgi:hypothetical protein
MVISRSDFAGEVEDQRIVSLLRPGQRIGNPAAEHFQWIRIRIGEQPGILLELGGDSVRVVG